MSVGAVIEDTMSDKKRNTDRKGDVQVLDRVKRPRRYRAILHNDNYTPRAFVVQVLEEIFRLSATRAAQTMLAVHNGEKGLIGVWSREIAESKSNTANTLARELGFPMMTTTEPE
ncbi:MAG: ATP-dependent Clp protease adaptor protein ClpS [Myxococcota bacterium]|jgi:ATP-dependent Clp protease adaptor protein ClpS